jgi:hypothetical protein
MLAVVQIQSNVVFGGCFCFMGEEEDDDGMVIGNP